MVSETDKQTAIKGCRAVVLQKSTAEAVLSFRLSSKPGSVVYGHLSCLYVAVKLYATHGVLPDKHQVSLPPQTVLLRIGFTFAQSRQCAGELLPRLSILTP